MSAWMDLKCRVTCSCTFWGASGLMKSTWMAMADEPSAWSFSRSDRDSFSDLLYVKAML